MRHPVIDLTGGAIVASSTYNCDAELGGLTQRLVHSVDGLSRPLFLGPSPGKQQHRRPASVVVHGMAQRLDPTLLRRDSLVNNEAGLRRNATRDFNRYCG